MDAQEVIDHERNGPLKYTVLRGPSGKYSYEIEREGRVVKHAGDAPNAADAMKEAKEQTRKHPSAVRQMDVGMLEAITASASKFWDKLSPAGRKAYVKEHPKSKYRTKSAGSPATGAPPSGSIRQHLEGLGWVQKGKVWQHPKSKRQLINGGATDEHLHHAVVTHGDGHVTRFKSNSEAQLRKFIGKMSQPKDNSGIGKVLGEKKGSLHEYFGIEHGKPLPLGNLEKLANSDHPLAGRARLVLNLKRARKRGPVEYKAVSTIVRQLLNSFE